MVLGKILGFLLGYLALAPLRLGPLGAIIGLWLGAMFDKGLKLNMRIHASSDSSKWDTQNQNSNDSQSNYSNSSDYYQSSRQYKTNDYYKAYNFYDYANRQQHFHQDKTDKDNELREAYKILGLSYKAPFASVKKAYRQLMNQYHPDKLMAKDLPEGILEMAKEKAQKISAAYDMIRKFNKN